MTKQNIMHVFYTLNNKYVIGCEEDYHNNAIEGGYTFFKGYNSYNRPKNNLKNVISEVKNSIYNGVKYDAIQLYKDRYVSTDGTTQYIKDKLIIIK